MEIFETLRLEHANLERLLDELIEGASGSKDEKLMDLKLAIVAHDRAEEEIVYEVLRRIPYRGETADLRTEEHFLNESVLADLEDVDSESESWPILLDVFKNQLESHVAEEETFVFSLLRDHLEEGEAEKLATDFERRRDEILASERFHPQGRPPINPAGLDLG